MAAASVESAILIDYQWRQRIFDSGKTWELRSKACLKRGRIGVACAAKSSPTGKSLLMGEVALVDCLKVAESRRGFVAPPLQNPENYMFLKRHVQKHQVTSVKAFPQIAQYKQVLAWVFESAFRYDSPQPLRRKPGCVVWVDLKSKKQ